jgi:hypothetical protein
VVPTTVALILVGSTTELMKENTTMAEARSTATVADVVAQVRDGQLDDFLREAVALIAREVMEAEIAGHLGAELGEISAERSAYRNGYRARPWETRVGEIELLVPKARSGPAYFPSFLEARKRSEQAILAVVMEAYVNGVSTRKVDRLVEQLGVHGMTKDRVSAICRGLDDQVTAFRRGRCRAPTPTCGWTPSTSRSARPAGSSPRRLWSPTPSTRPACGR